MRRTVTSYGYVIEDIAWRREDASVFSSGKNNILQTSAASEKNIRTFKPPCNFLFIL